MGKYYVSDHHLLHGVTYPTAKDAIDATLAAIATATGTPRELIQAFHIPWTPGSKGDLVMMNGNPIGVLVGTVTAEHEDPSPIKKYSILVSSWGGLPVTMCPDGTFPKEPHGH